MVFFFLPVPVLYRSCPRRRAFLLGPLREGAHCCDVDKAGGRARGFGGGASERGTRVLFMRAGLGVRVVSLPL